MAILINDTTPRAQYTATAGQTVFSVPFEFFSNADLKVYKNATLQTLTTHYTVTGAGVTGGGAMTLTSGASAGDTITILRDIPVARTSDFPTAGKFNIDALNADLDRLTAMMQEREVQIGRAMRLPDTDTATSLVLPATSARAGKVLIFNASTGAPEAGPSVVDITAVAPNAALAAASATAAAASASSAAGSATTASTASTSASSSASAAASSAATASSAASTATTQASAASASASAAAVSASTASTASSDAAASAGLANDWATKTSGTVAGGEYSAKYHANAAASSASSAASAKTAAEAARDQTLAAFDSFDDRYLGSKSSDPSVDNDGNALVAGALYFNSTSGVMKVYTGGGWVAAYVSGSTTGALLTANNLSDLTSVSSARTNLGLGTAATSAATDFAAASHTHPASAISDSTSAGRALLTAADAAAQRTSLGLGTAALSASSAFATAVHSHAIADVTGLQTALDAKLNLSGGQITGNLGVGIAASAKLDVSGNMAQNVVIVSASAIDCSSGNYFTKTASGALTWTFTNVPSSRAFSFILTLTNGGSGTQTWPTAVKWPSATAPTLTASGVDVLGFLTDDGGTTWRGVLLMKDSK